MIITIYNITNKIIIDIKEHGIIQEYLIYIHMIFYFMELIDIKSIFIHHSGIISSKKTNEYLKFFINELIYLFLNLKFLYIKFCFESGFKKTAINYFEMFRLHYEYIIPQDENFMRLFSVFNSSNSKDEKRGGLVEAKKDSKVINEKNMKLILYNYIVLMINFRAKNLKFLNKLK